MSIYQTTNVLRYQYLLVCVLTMTYKITWHIVMWPLRGESSIVTLPHPQVWCYIATLYDLEFRIMWTINVI